MGEKGVYNTAVFGVKKEVLRMRTLFFALLMFLVCSSVFAAFPQSNLSGRRKALNDLLAERWEYTLRTSPIFASYIGTSAGTADWTTSHKRP